MDEDPCPLCIIQRYFFVLIAIFAFLGARFSSWRGVRLLETLVGVVGARRASSRRRGTCTCRRNPGFSCGFDALQPIVDSLPPAHWLPQVFKVAGLCETALSADSRSVAAAVVAGRVRAGVLPLALSLVRNRRRIA